MRSNPHFFMSTKNDRLFCKTGTHRNFAKNGEILLLEMSLDTVILFYGKSCKNWGQGGDFREVPRTAPVEAAFMLSSLLIEFFLFYDCGSSSLAAAGVLIFRRASRHLSIRPKWKTDYVV